MAGQVTRPRVAFVVEWFYPLLGGAGVQAFRIAQELKDQYRFTFLTKQVQNAPKQDRQGPFPVVRFGKSGLLPKLQDYLAAIELCWWLLKNRGGVDLIHLHGNLENNFAVAATLAGKLSRTPVIGKLAIAGELESHLESTGSYTSGQKLLKNLNPLNWLRRRLARNLDAYQAISSAIVRELRSLGIPEEKIRYIPNGVDGDLFKPVGEEEKRRLRKKLGLPPDKKILLTVSRLARHKGIIDPLLAAWKKHFTSRSDLVLLIIGSGEGLASSIEKEAVEVVASLGPPLDPPPKPYLAAGANVQLLGRRRDILPYYQAADVFILPSENEGLANALLEAAACGLVCIVSNVSGSQDLIHDQLNGFTFEAGDSEKFRKTVNCAVELEKRWGVFSEQIRSNVTKLFDVRETSSAVQKVYDSFI